LIYRSPFPDIHIPTVPLQEYVFTYANRWHDKIALVDGLTGRKLTYAQLCNAIKKTAAGLLIRGLKKGDVCAIYSPNLPEYAIAFFGIATAGGVNTTINPLHTASELHKQLKDARAKFLVTTPQLLNSARIAIADTTVEEIFVFGKVKGATPFASLMNNQSSRSIEFNTRDDLVALPYSSGTTGLPKGVMLTHYNLLANIAQTNAVEALSEEDSIIAVLPFYHIYGMVAIMSRALYAGATIVTMEKFNLEIFLKLLQQYEVRIAHLVPPIVLALAKHPTVDNYDLSKLESVVSGAAPLSESVANACASRHKIIVRQGYGLTETSSVTHSNSRNLEIKVKSVGTAIPNTVFRIIDLSTRNDVKKGEVGEIWIRGPQLMKGYLNNPDATQEIIDKDGWLHTGDIGCADEDGYLYVIDRIKELIKHKGTQVAPAELEAVLQSHPAVTDAAVIPSPHTEAGEIPKAFVVIKAGDSVTKDEIMSYVNKRVASYKKIRRIEFIDVIPKIPSGKILRRKLIERERAMSG